MKHKAAINFPLGVFFVTMDITAISVAIFACLAKLSNAGITISRVPYISLLLLLSIGGGLVAALFVWRREAPITGKISELERVTDSLRSDAERREEFIASFAHELKTPLTAIIGYADMLRSKDMAPKPRFTAAGYIFSEGKRLEALSLKLLDIIVVGKQGLSTRRFDAGYFLREVAAVTLPAAAQDGINLEVHAERGEVDLEPDLFKTLLINLVDNARKASSRGGSLELLGRKEGEGYAFYVVDHGKGMKREELSKITEPFYMIDKSRSRAQSGAGLGLALCKRIADLHGTELEYVSAPNVGTTVRVFLKGGDEDAQKV